MAETGLLGQTGVIVLVSLIGLACGVRRFCPQVSQRFRARNHLESLGLLALTPQCSVALVRAGQEMLVLGVTPQAVTLLAKMPEAAVFGKEGNRAMEKESDGETERPNATVIEETGAAP
jgi:flagellar biogenesis protein FliO